MNVGRLNKAIKPENHLSWPTKIRVENDDVFSRIIRQNIVQENLRPIAHTSSSNTTSTTSLSSIHSPVNVRSTTVSSNSIPQNVFSVTAHRSSVQKQQDSISGNHAGSAYETFLSEVARMSPFHAQNKSSSDNNIDGMKKNTSEDLGQSPDPLTMLSSQGNKTDEPGANQNFSSISANMEKTSFCKQNLCNSNHVNRTGQNVDKSLAELIQRDNTGFARQNVRITFSPASALRKYENIENMFTKTDSNTHTNQYFTPNDVPSTSRATTSVYPKKRNVTNSSGSNAQKEFHLSSDKSSFLQKNLSRTVPTISTHTFSNDKGRAFSTPNSKRTATSSTLRTPKSGGSTMASDTSSIIAVAEGRGVARCEVGLASIDPQHPQLVLCQISDNSSYIRTLTKMNILNPVEIIVPHTFSDSKLLTTIREAFPLVTISTVLRRHFNYTCGLQFLQNLTDPAFASVEISVKHKFYALSAAAALVKYVEFKQNTFFSPKSLKVTYEGPSDSTVIDINTATRLELVSSLQGSSAQYSLLGVLNHCSTSGGTRLLRANILQPPCTLKNILNRSDCIEELLLSPGLFYSLQEIIPKFAGVEKLIALCMHLPKQDSLKAAEVQLTQTILLKTMLELVPVLLDSLKEGTCDFLKYVKEVLSDCRFHEILSSVLEVIQEDVYIAKSFTATHMQRGFAVKINSDLLAVARKVYSEIINEINRYVEGLVDKYGLPFHTGFNQARGFHIQLTKTDSTSFNLEKLSPEFIMIQKNHNTFSFTTPVLFSANERCTSAYEEIQLFSNVYIFELLTKIRRQVTCIYKLCEVIAELDMLISFTKISSVSNYVKPDFSHFLHLIESRHPILDHINPTTPVPNDVYAHYRYNCHIITGPNMSGKSLYIRQIILLQILAQIGCYVPAKKATFRIADHIFSRIGFDDSVEDNCSSFSLEIKEMQYILNTITPCSIVIIDELCRSTSWVEGTAIAWAIVTELMQSDSFIFLTTHFLTLTKLAELYPNVKNHQLEVRENVSDEYSALIYTHKLLPGVTAVEHYGLKLVQGIAFPERVLNRAKEIAKSLSLQKLPNLAVENLAIEHATYHLVSEALEMLEVADSGKLSSEQFIQLREKYLLPLSSISEDTSEPTCQAQNQDNNENSSQNGDGCTDVEVTTEYDVANSGNIQAEQ